MSTSRICPVCGKGLPVDAPKGLCPECLVGQATGRNKVDAPIGTAHENRRQFGDYELLGEIAAGGMGTVYCARQKSLNRIVALKMIRSGRLASAAEVERFHTEAEAAANLAHPNIVPIYEVGEREGQHYFTMKLIEGGHLGEMNATQRQRGVDWLRRAGRLVVMVARAAHHAHQRGVLHRDIKPTNILLDDHGEPQLTDFGLAKLAHKESTLTATEAIIGTPHYMAPEQAGGKARHVTTVTDVFSLGAILYELTSGRPPFEGESAIEILTRVRQSEPAPLRKLNAAVDRDLETICMKCLEKDPSRRYASAEALATDLERWLEGKPIAARAITAPERLRKWARRNPGVSAAVGFAIMMLVAGVAGICVQWQRAQANANQSRERLVRLNVSSGVRLLDSGNDFGSLVWFAHALSLENGNTEKEAPHRLRFASVLRECPSLLQLWCPGGPVDSGTFSPDGKYVLATAGEQVYLWDTLTGKAVISPISHPGGRKVEAQFSADGKRLLTVNGDSALIWSVDTGEQVMQAGHGDVLHAAFASVGGTLATASHSGSVVLWRISGTSAVRQMSLQGTFPVRRLQFSPNAQRLLGWERDGLVCVWDLNSEHSAPLSWKPKGGLRAVEFNFDGTLIVTAQSDGTAQVRDAVTGDSVTTFQKEGTWLTHATFSPDGRWVATSAGGHIARVWDAASGKRIASLGGHKNVMLGCAFSPSGHRVVTASFDGTARVYERATGKALTPPLPHGGLITAAQFHPDGQRVLTASADGTVKLWSIWPKTGFTVPWNDESVRIVNYSLGGERLILQDASNRLRVLDAKTWQQVSANMALPQPTRSAWLRDDEASLLALYRAGSGKMKDFVLETWEPKTGRRLAEVTIPGSGSDWLLASEDCSRVAVIHGKALEVFESATGKPSFTAPHHSSESIKRVQFSPDASRVLVSSGSSVSVLNANGGASPYGPLRHASTVSDANFSPDGRWIVTSCLDTALEAREAQVWDARTGEPIGPGMRHADGIFHAAFTSNSRRVLTAGEDGMARLWDALSGRAVSAPFRHSVAVNHASCSEDGTLVATASHDKTARLWDAKMGDPVTPKIVHPSVKVLGKDTGVDRAFFIGGGRYLLTRYSSALSYLWELPSENRPAKDLMSLAELLSGHDLDLTGALEPLRQEAVAQSWASLRAKYPAEFAWRRFIEKIPERSLTPHPGSIDLSPHFNASLKEAFNLNSSAEGVFRAGVQTFAGSDFDLRGIVQLTGEELYLRAPRPFPEAVTGIRIEREFSRLHLLHSAAGFEQPGVTVARLVMHYADGAARELPLVAGEDLNDWRPGPLTPARADVAWQGDLYPTRSWSATVQLFKSSWNNPRPGVPVKCIDYISNMTRAAPFMMAITVEP